MHHLPRSETHSSLLGQLVLAAAIATTATPSFATEGGGSTWPLGLENFVAAALPPPGFYGMVFGNYYHADRLKDGQGNTIPLAFDLKAAVVAPRLVWVTGEKFLGGQLAFHAVAPLLNLKVSVAGTSQTKSGLGDMTVGPVLGYHYSPAHRSGPMGIARAPCRSAPASSTTAAKAGSSPRSGRRKAACATGPKATRCG